MLYGSDKIKFACRNENKQVRVEFTCRRPTWGTNLTSAWHEIGEASFCDLPSWCAPTSWLPNLLTGWCPSAVQSAECWRGRIDQHSRIIRSRRIQDSQSPRNSSTRSIEQLCWELRHWRKQVYAEYVLYVHGWTLFQPYLEELQKWHCHYWPVWKSLACLHGITGWKSMAHTCTRQTQWRWQLSNETLNKIHPCNQYSNYCQYL